MVRFINCMRRRTGLTPEQFRKHWQDPKFTALIERVVALTDAKRYAKTATLVVEANMLVIEQRGTGVPYDGVLEYWWDNATHLLKALETPAGRALQQDMLTYQKQFVDFAGSTAFFTEG